MDIDSIAAAGRTLSRTARGGVAAALLPLLALGGCASTGPVVPDDSGQYDGLWRALIQPADRFQRSNGWHMSCEDMSGEFAFVVRDGMANFQLLGEAQQVPVSAKGRFEVRQLSGFSVDESPTSDVGIEDGQVTLVVRGSLAATKLSGELRELVREINAGCRSKVLFERVDS